MTEPTTTAAGAAPTSSERRIEYLTLDQLVPNPRNPKAHRGDLIEASVSRFGMIDPIVRDDRTGYIVSGHGRTEALREKFARGEEPPEGVRVDPVTGDWRTPVYVGWASRNDDEAAAALIGLNRTTETGGWEDDALLELLDSIAASGAGFEGVGYDEAEIDDLRAYLEEDLAVLELNGDESAPAAPTDASTATAAAADAELDPDAAPGDAVVAAAAYAEQGRRLVVLDYSIEEFDEVAPRIKQLRKQLGVESNAEAMRLHLMQLIPELAASIDTTPTAEDGADYAEVEVSTKQDAETGA